MEDTATFVDEQRTGPFRFWYQKHCFETVVSRTRSSDQVSCELPFGPLGDLVHAMWVGTRLKSIVNYRSEKAISLF